MTTLLLRKVRVAIARALDAPTATIVLDGSSLDPMSPRDEVLEWMRPHRLDTIRLRPQLGLKTTVVMAPLPDGTITIHFFQGDGVDVDASVAVCLNSMTAAVTVAIRCWNMSSDARAVVMAGETYGFEAAA
jgi:hypothetical protein